MRTVNLPGLCVRDDLDKPLLSPIIILLPFPEIGNLPIFTFFPVSFAFASVKPALAISGVV